MHEGDNNSAQFERAQELFAKAYSIWILGFGYHPENMRRLNLPFDRLQQSQNRVYIVGTAYNMTTAEADTIRLVYGNARWPMADVRHKITEALRNDGNFQKWVR
jgi:hypothetical protein